MTGKILRSFWAMLASAAALAPALAAAQDEGHPVPGQIGLQPSVTPIMDSVHVFHNGVLLWSIGLITLLVLVLLVVVMVRFNARANPTPSRTTHNTVIEVIWTVVPILVLVVIAIPSFGVLSDQLTTPDGERRYLGENIFSFGEVEVPAPELTIKATGQQWYWDYEYMDADVAFSQNLLPNDERLALKPAQPRLLAVDYELVVPVDTTVRMLVTADPGGVIHAWAVPSFGVTIDAIPGKLNETWFNARKTGIYYGQCRELCGKDHAFMPIAVRVVEKEEFAFWMETIQQGFIDDANDTLPRVQ